MSEVSIRKLTKQFDGKQVLNGIDLEVAEGELVVLLGPSGCGKTTLLRCLAGLEEISSGQIAIGRKNVDSPEDGVLVPPNKRNIGVVFQSYALWPHMTVRGNVAYALKLARTPSDQIEHQVSQALTNLNILERADEYAGRLSGGQQQRVALARAIAMRPKLMLFDEPLSNLDAKLRLKVRLDIRKLHRRSGITAVYVTHDQEEAMALADRIAVMNHGEIQQLASPEVLYNEPVNAFVADFMGFENLIPGKAVWGEGGHSEFRSEDGAFTVPLNKSVEPVKVGLLALRAVHLPVVPEASSDEGGVLLRGTVVTSTYLGDHTEVLVDVGKTRLFASMSEDERLHRGGSVVRGSSITLRLIAHKAVPLQAEGLPSASDVDRVPVSA